MKRYFGIFGAALVGGLVSVAVVKGLENEPKPLTLETQLNTPSDNHFTRLPRTAPMTSVDLTAAAEKTVNGVVHVKVKTEGQQYYQVDPFQYFFGTPNPQLKKGPSKMGAGSGVVISNDGYIVTNNHVIDNADEIEITLSDNNSYKAKLIGADPNTDLALIKVDAENLDFVPLGNSDQAKLGEWVLAVGNPLNLTSTVTAGIISAKGRNINLIGGNNRNTSPIESFIQTDAAVNPGNSGGALVNTNGELIGINTAIKSPTGSYTGYSFAVPVNIVKKVVDDLLEFGTVQRGYIGVSIRNINEELAQKNDLETLNGVFVAGLMEEGAASDAGIEQGDVIHKVGNVSVNNVPELQEQIGRFRPGDEVMVTVNRDGDEKQFAITLRNKFGNTDLVKKETTKLSAALGATFEKVTDKEMARLNIENGMKISDLNGGKLRSAGIKEGFIITRVDKKKIENFDQLANALDGKKGGILIEGVYPNGQKRYYGLGM